MNINFCVVLFFPCSLFILFMGLLYLDSMNRCPFLLSIISPAVRRVNNNNFEIVWFINIKSLSLEYANNHHSIRIENRCNEVSINIKIDDKINCKYFPNQSIPYYIELAKFKNIFLTYKSYKSTNWSFYIL